MDPAALKIIKDLRERAAKRKRRPPRVSTWTQRERYKGEVIESYNVVLVTRGCGWYHSAGCSMCGYSNDSDSSEDIKLEVQLTKVEERYKDQPLAKMFTSGSFFDEKELRAEERQAVLEKMAELLKGRDAALIVESRPRYISKEVLDESRELLGDIALTVAIGLESSNDKVLKESINKGFTFEDYKQAAKTITEAGAQVKTYLLLKPPLLSEADAVKDCVNSIRDVTSLNIPQTISVNPMNVQNYTLVEYMFRRGEYRPPWIWSVIDVLQQGGGLMPEGSWLLCHPTAGGKSRGVHNCGECDADFLEAVSDFSLTNDPAALTGLDCACKKEYAAYLLDCK